MIWFFKELFHIIIMSEQNAFKTTPKGFSFALLYQKNKNAIGLFPTPYRAMDVNKLPLEHNVTPHVNRYYFAWQFEPKKWNVDIFAVGEGHGALVKEGTRVDMKKYLLCYSHADAKYDFLDDKGIPYEERQTVYRDTLAQCFKSFKLT